VNLEQLRKQAKELVRAARAGDADALARLDGEPRLARAQFVLAREHGYPSWPALVAAVEANPEAFVLAATDHPNRTRADALLAARPEIARDPWARLVLGRGFDGDPNAPGGPRNWAPLLYVTHSCYATPALARDLLARGADPNARFTNEYGEMSALYGAAGKAHDPELTRVLLEAGADPDDGESLYHATEAPDPACLKLLLDHGAETECTNALAHALDEDHYEHVRLLLEAGAEAKGGILAHAVRRGRGPEYLTLLVRHGAPLDVVGGETWRGDIPLRTPYQHAVLRGRKDNAETLADLGAKTDVAPEDLAVASIAKGEPPAAPLPETLDPDGQEVIILAALRGQLDAVIDAVGPNFAGVVGGSPDGTLLHHAAWVGDPLTVERLLAAGADVNPTPTGEERDTPLAWAAHGSTYHGMPGRDYVAVAEALVAAGNPIDPVLLEAAQGPLYDWLDERLG
jgi:ankyrin repeat protein